jgi:competence protein ComGC
VSQKKFHSPFIICKNDFIFLNRYKASRLAFSLVETLVVISILGVLLGLLLPAVQSVRQSANKISCQNNLKQCAIAVHSFDAVHSRMPPYPYLKRNPIFVIPPLMSWHVGILDFVEQSTAFHSAINAYSINPFGYVSPPHNGYRQVIKLYVCPSDSRLYSVQTTSSGNVLAMTDYIGVSMGSPSGDLNKSLPGILGSPLPLSNVIDGTSNTLMIGERPPPLSLQAGGWYTTAETESLGGPSIIFGYARWCVCIRRPVFRVALYSWKIG